MMMVWRIRFRVHGGHVHCRLFGAPQANRTYAWCGDFTVRKEEFASLQTAFQGAEFVED